MLKILFVHNTLPEYRIKWFEHISEITNTAFVVSNKSLSQKLYNYVDNKFECIYLNKGIAGCFELTKILKNNKFDFIQLPPVDSPREFLLSIILLFFAKTNNIKTGYFWEKWEAPSCKQPFLRRLKNFILGFVAKIIYKHCDIIFSPGIRNYEYFVKHGVDPAKIKKIYNSTMLPRENYIDIRKKFSISDDKIILLYLGRVIREKGLDYLIKSIGLLTDSYKNKLHLLVAGDGAYLNECKKLAEDIALDSVTFAGFVDQSLRNNFIRQCDCFVFPCTYYNGWVDVWGLTLNEAIECGKYIIATESVGSAYELVNELNGRIVEPENAIAIKDTIIEFIGNYDNLINSSIIKDKELYSIYNVENSAREYVKCIEELVEIENGGMN